MRTKRKRTKAPAPVVEPILLKPEDAARAIGIGRTKMFDLLARGKVPSKRVGSSLRVPLEALREWAKRTAS